VSSDQLTEFDFIVVSHAPIACLNILVRREYSGVWTFYLFAFFHHGSGITGKLFLHNKFLACGLVSGRREKKKT
jgi:hypothetical protein